MKTSSIVIIVLAIAVVALCVRVIFFPEGGKSGESATTTIDDIMSRTSIRAFQDQEVDEETVEILLKAAMAAPTARNDQPWRFVVVTDKEVLASISEAFGTLRAVADAPMAVVVCGDVGVGGERSDWWVQDASAATQNLLLAAHSLDLGAVWCGIYPRADRVDFIREKLQLPGNIIPLNVVPIGYPAENPGPKDKWHPEYIHYNVW